MCELRCLTGQSPCHISRVVSRCSIADSPVDNALGARARKHRKVAEVVGYCRDLLHPAVLSARLSLAHRQRAPNRENCWSILFLG